ncbi:MAG: DUF2889 domain-containing protein [Myxococcota bacterium]|nr:DUF2889 domain-containing protein [Myxococcota bacterium]
MPLKITGVPLHTRSLTIVAALRGDGRWDVRGDIIDLRKCGFVPMTQDVQPSGIIHHMTIKQVVDPNSLRIDSLEVAQPHVAIDASERTSGECCRDPSPRLQALQGEVMDEHFGRKLSSEFGGALGCSHLLTLFFGMAAAIPRAVMHEEEVARRHREKRHVGERLFWRSIFIDGFEIEGGEIEISVQLADVHSRPHEMVETPLERLERQEEVRIVGLVEPPAFRIGRLQATERVRVLPNLADAVWHDRSDELEPLLGHPIVPGLSSRVRDLLGARGDRALVRDALLQMAPGHIQVLAAITDRWFVRTSTETPTGTKSNDTKSNGKAEGPPVGAIGGMINSCYMWREGSPLISERQRAMARRQAAFEEE